MFGSVLAFLVPTILLYAAVVAVGHRARRDRRPAPVPAVHDDTVLVPQFFTLAAIPVPTR